MELGFEWDEKKALQNIEKHGISFEEAKTVFNDPFSITTLDTKHSFNDVGLSTQGKLLVVVYIESLSNIRIISCRQATKVERKAYEHREF
jgi:uncharacterized protein